MAARDLDSIWYGQASVLGRVASLGLTPLGWIYRAGLLAHGRMKDPIRVERPVIGIGNLTVGGNGKTPLAMELTRLLMAQGRRVALVSRGYGRSSRGSRVVHAPGGEMPDPGVCGDEPALMAQRCPSAVVVVGENRVDAARLAIESFNPDVIVCDDVFQHIRLARDLNLLAVHAKRGFGNRRLLPAGPMREPLSAADRADLVVFTHSDGEPVERLLERHGLPKQMPAVACRFEPTGFVKGASLQATTDKTPERVVAACGIAYPAGFFASLQTLGLELVDSVAFRDHHPWSRADLEKLLTRTAELGADALVMTEKDLLKLPAVDTKIPVLALRIEARWADETSLSLVNLALEQAIGCLT